ncbi:hypothetical protein WOLCODRAFT_16103 [Wolfiporia cocos MD-104 SS10]|uniref:PDZ GRASP-type domain-containing protein n=1 Tax=Wolfiporia cocos (strain MD-104) TaxID=742152 RepID=A0A2H3JBX7_WOLCO|nr:hypothetical protein WOLCODRAFT_16103 [Wolfiporia cocos MD-104 SS10]
MGAGQSTAAQTPPRALHVLRVTPSSPASHTNIEPYFDFVVGFQGDNFATRNTVDATELERIVEDHEGRTLNLLIWNSKSQQLRVVPIVPSRGWALPDTKHPGAQEPEAEHKPSLLGLSMRMCEPEFALDNVWHVLDVLEGSPAESAGLVPYGDWVIGWSGGVLSAESDFYEVVEAHIEKPLRVTALSGKWFSFQIDNGVERDYLDRKPGSLPPELAEYSDEYEDQRLFVPADLQHGSEFSEQGEDEERWQEEEWMRQSYASAYEHVHENETSSAYSPWALTRYEPAGSSNDHLESKPRRPAVYASISNEQAAQARFVNVDFAAS